MNNTCLHVYARVSLQKRSIVHCEYQHSFSCQKLYIYMHNQFLSLSLSLSLSLCRHYGLVTSACSLLEELAHINSLGFSECVSPAVTRLSRVRNVYPYYLSYKHENKFQSEKISPKLVNPRCMHKGYGSHSVCLCVCVCVCLSVCLLPH